MLLSWLVPSAALLGHLCLLVYLVNVAHALGLKGRAMALLFAALIAFGALGAGCLLVQAAGARWLEWPRPVLGYAAACLAVATVGLPLSTWLRHARREPEGVSSRSAELDLARSHGREALIGQGPHAWMLRLPGNASLRLRRVEWRVEVPGLPPGLEGLSFVQVADLHFAACYDRRYFDAVIDEAARWESDFVLFTGDLIDDPECVAWIEPVLGRLRGRLGSFAILGNHDYWFDPRPIRRALHRAGYLDLERSWHVVETGGGPRVAFGGTSSPWGPAPVLAGPADADLRVLLSHSPDLFYQAARAGVDLIFSGHNHGGQVRLPLVGPILMPSRYSRRFDRGFFGRGRTRMYISQGIGARHPLRYGCVPEIARFELRASRPGDHPTRDRSAYAARCEQAILIPSDELP